MIFYTRINVNDIDLIRFGHMAKNKFNNFNGNLLLTDPKESQNKNDMWLYVRGLGGFKLVDYDERSSTGFLAYEDFVVGSTSKDRPVWFDHVKDRILDVVASNDYGSGQNLQVAESIIYKSAEARIRCEQSQWNRSGCVFKLKIVASGDHTSLGDAMYLHAMILAGNYS